MTDDAEPSADAPPSSALSGPMGPERLATFSDAVIAVIITVLVLEFAVPAGGKLTDLLPLVPNFFAYALSFTFVGIYWTNHHHLMRAAVRVNARVMWANLLLLFWMALIPFVTAWLGNHPGERWPTFTYGLICLVTGVAYALLSRTVVNANAAQAVARRLGRDYKGLISGGLYVLGCGIAFVAPFVSTAIFVAVAVLWLVPDRRLTRP